jgi:hypothetical protein
VKRSPMSAVRAILIFLAFGGGLYTLLALSAEAATVFSNYNGVNCGCGGADGFFAEGFIPAGDFDFTGAGAFVQTSSFNPQSFSVALYSTNAGAPGSPLWTSGTLTAPGLQDSPTLVSASYAGSPILLQTGNMYFLVLNISGSDSPSWLGQGSSSAPLFSSLDAISWNNLGEASLQFQVFGAAAPVAIVPEPASWVMLLLGFGLVGFAASRRARKIVSR